MSPIIPVYESNGQGRLWMLRMELVCLRQLLSHWGSLNRNEALYTRAKIFTHYYILLAIATHFMHAWLYLSSVSLWASDCVNCIHPSSPRSHCSCPLSHHLQLADDIWVDLYAFSVKIYIIYIYIILLLIAIIILYIVYAI